MNLEYFIAKRLISTKGYKSSVSSPIIKIAVSAIAIGIIMMLVSVATGIGLQQKIREKLSVFNGHITINHFDENESKVSIVPLSSSQNFYPTFKNIDGIDHIQAVANKAGIIRNEKTFEGILFKGVGKDYKWDHLKEYLVSGTIPTLNQDLNNEVILSEYLANRLELKVGETFNTFFMKETSTKSPNLRVFKLVGIYNSGFQEFDSSLVLGDIRHIQRMNKWQANQIGHFEVFIRDFSDIESINKAIYTKIPSDLDTKTIIEKYSSIFEWLTLFDINIIIILTIMILVATINMIVVLLVLILERTQMIGILKALGASNWSIRKLFLYNAAYLIGKGLIYGNGIGLSLLFLQKQFGIIKLEPANYYVNQAPVHIEMGHIIALNAGTIIICLLVLLIPSYLISKISPATAIRYN